MVVSAVPDESEFKPMLIVGFLGLYSIVQFAARPFVNHTENFFDLLASVLITLTYSEGFWATQHESENVPAGYFVVLTINVLYVVALVVATAWPLLIALKEWIQKRRKRQEISFLELRSEEVELREKTILLLEMLSVEQLQQIHDLIASK